MLKLKDALRIVPYFVFTTVGAERVPLVHSTPQSCPIFAYREADAPLMSTLRFADRAGPKVQKPFQCRHIVVSDFLFLVL